MNKGKCLFMRLVLIIGLIVQCALLQASTLIDGLYYDLDTSNRTATVTYETTGSNNYASLPADVVIPESVTYEGITYSVTKIGDEAFSDCKVMESISIPASVVQVGDIVDEASSLPFYNCFALKRIRLEDSSAAIYFGYSIYRASMNHPHLEYIYIGRNINYLGMPSPYDSYYSPFSAKSYIKEVIVSKNVTEIPEKLFYDSSLTSISLPNVEKIGSFAFYNTKLENVTFGQSLKKIDSFAFGHCRNLLDLALPKSLKKIRMGAFTECSKLSVLEIECSLDTIPKYAFSDCINLTSIKLPSSVKVIGDKAFENDSSIVTIFLNDGLKKIGAYVFANNSYVKRLSIPGSVLAIGQNAFYGCTRLSYIGFEDNAQSLIIDNTNTISSKVDALTKDNKYRNRVYDYFCDCPLTELYIGRNIEYKYKESAVIYDLSGKSWVLKNRASAPFANKETLRKITIGRDVTKLYNNFCDACSNLNDVVLGESLQVLSNSSFRNCVNLSKISFPSSLTEIGTAAFAKCKSLKTVSYTETSKHLLSIGDSAFYCCALKRISIPAQVSVIGSYAFAGNSLNEFYISKNSKDSLEIKDHVFSYSSMKQLSIPGRVSKIGNFAFWNCIELEELKFEDSHTAIQLGYGSDGFYDGSGREDLLTPLFGDCRLKYLYIGRNLDFDEKELNHSPFLRQYVLKKIEFSDSGTVTYLRNRLFYEQTVCDSIVLPKSLEEIGEYAFYGMSKLKEIVIPNNVRKIGKYAFANDVLLNKVTLSSSCQELPSYMFSGCTSLDSLCIPKCVIKINSTVLDDCRKLRVAYFEDSSNDLKYETISSFSKLFYSSIDSVYLGRNISFEEKSPFSGTKLKKIILSSTVKTIPANMFRGCKELNQVVMADRVSNIGANAFYKCESLKNIDLSKGLQTIETAAFRLCKKLDNLLLPDSLISISSFAFADCSSMTKITLGKSLKRIDAASFKGCVSLKTINIPESLRSLGDNSFDGCIALATIDMNKISYLGVESFKGCSALNNIDFGKELLSIGRNAFEGCYNINKVTINVINPPVSSANFPLDVTSNVILYVPQGTYDLYKQSDSWEDWKNIKEITSAITLTLNLSDAHLKASETLALAATVGPDEATNKKVDWKSDDETVASVSADGVVTAHKVGQTSIHAIANDGGGAKATCTITVDPTMVSSISLSQENLAIRKNHTAQLSAIVAPTDATNASFIWSSNNEDVAKVSEDGVISAIAPGDAVIKATSQDGSQVEASCQVKVLPVLKGDSNDDDEINVVDAVNTVNYIFNKVTGTFVFEAADVNSDDHISISDVTGTTDLIMQQVLQVKEQGAMAKGYGVSAMDDASSSDRSLDCLVLSQQDKSNIDIALDNNSNFAALQADITLPVNVNDVEVKLSGVMATTHQLSYSKLNAHTLRVVVYSLSNSTFMDGQPIFCLSSKKNLDAKNIGVTNAIGSDVEAKGYRLTSRNNEVTSIDGIVVDGTSVKVVADGLMFTGLKGTPIYIYTTSGILVKTFSLASETSKIALQAGVYLVKMNGQVVKITVK